MAMTPLEARRARERPAWPGRAEGFARLTSHGRPPRPADFADSPPNALPDQSLRA